MEATQPFFFEVNRPEDRERFELVVQSGVHVQDTLAEQIEGLIQSRIPHQKLTKEELQTKRTEFLQPYAEKKLSFGTWVYFPWRGTLVHLLPKDLYHELRTNRNRNKITDEEQKRLRMAVVAVAGLSTGSSIAITLAMQGIGHRFKIADFDHMEVSNLNRLQAGVLDLGVNKAHITARRLLELDPYLEVEMFPEGVTEQNLDAFLTGTSVLFEECDSFDIKVTLRKRARQLRLPVIMLTSDSGLVDIERFDIEPDRPLFHGLAEDIDLDALERGDWQTKLQFAARINDMDKISERMKASIVEIEQTLLTWPQLASDVVLGGAVGAHVAKDILLGIFSDSGRFYFDPAKVFVNANPSNEHRLPRKRKEGDAIPPRSHEAPPTHQQLASLVSTLLTGSASMEVENNFLRTLVHFGQRAPSGGNVQPWLFVRIPNWVQTEGTLSFSLMCRLNPHVPAARSAPDRLPDYIALGAAVENMVIALQGTGVVGRVDWSDTLNAPAEFFVSSNSSPSSSAVKQGAILTFVIDKGSKQQETDALVGVIFKRVSNRNDIWGSATPLEEHSMSLLRNACEGLFGGAFALTVRANDVENQQHLERLGMVSGEMDRVRFLSPVMRKDLIEEIRWTEEEAKVRRDGLDIPSLQLPPGGEITLEVLRTEGAMELLRSLNLGSAFTRGSKLRVARSRAVAMLSTRDDTSLPSVNFNAGRVLQRLWLTATVMVVGFQPMYATLFVRNFVQRQIESQDQATKLMNKELLKNVDEQLAFFNASSRNYPHPIFIFALTDAPPPKERSYRRDFDSCLILPSISKAAL